MGVSNARPRRNIFFSQHKTTCIYHNSQQLHASEAPAPAALTSLPLFFFVITRVTTGQGKRSEVFSSITPLADMPSNHSDRPDFFFFGKYWHSWVFCGSRAFGGECRLSHPTIIGRHHTACCFARGYRYDWLELICMAWLLPRNGDWFCNLSIAKTHPHLSPRWKKKKKELKAALTS